MNALIRNTRREDFEAVVSLLAQLWPGKTVNPKNLARTLDRMVFSDNTELLCAERDGKVVAFASLATLSNLWQEGLVLYLTTMIVDEQHRRSGIGKLLMERVLEIARKRGCAKIELESAFDRVEAHAFYKKMGFEKRAYFFSRGVE